jgi:hypothetical protein
MRKFMVKKIINEIPRQNAGDVLDVQGYGWNFNAA